MLDKNDAPDDDQGLFDNLLDQDTSEGNTSTADPISPEAGGYVPSAENVFV